MFEKLAPPSTYRIKCLGQNSYLFYGYWECENFTDKKKLFRAVSDYYPLDLIHDHIKFHFSFLNPFSRPAAPVQVIVYAQGIPGDYPLSMKLRFHNFKNPKDSKMNSINVILQSNSLRSYITFNDLSWQDFTEDKGFIEKGKMRFEFDIQHVVNNVPSKKLSRRPFSSILQDENIILPDNYGFKPYNDDMPGHFFYMLYYNKYFRNHIFSLELDDKKGRGINSLTHAVYKFYYDLQVNKIAPSSKTLHKRLGCEYSENPADVLATKFNTLFVMDSETRIFVRSLITADEGNKIPKKPYYMLDKISNPSIDPSPKQSLDQCLKEQDDVYEIGDLFIIFINQQMEPSKKIPTLYVPMSFQAYEVLSKQAKQDNKTDEYELYGVVAATQPLNEQKDYETYVQAMGKKSGENVPIWVQINNNFVGVWDLQKDAFKTESSQNEPPKTKQYIHLDDDFSPQIVIYVKKSAFSQFFENEVPTPKPPAQNIKFTYHLQNELMSRSRAAEYGFENGKQTKMPSSSKYENLANSLKLNKPSIILITPTLDKINGLATSMNDEIDHNSEFIVIPNGELRNSNLIYDDNSLIVFVKIYSPFEDTGVINYLFTIHVKLDQNIRDALQNAVCDKIGKSTLTHIFRETSNYYPVLLDPDQTFAANNFKHDDVAFLVIQVQMEEQSNFVLEEPTVQRPHEYDDNEVVNGFTLLPNTEDSPETYDLYITGIHHQIVFGTFNRDVSCESGARVPAAYRKSHILQLLETNFGFDEINKITIKTGTEEEKELTDEPLYIQTNYQTFTELHIYLSE